MEAITSMMTEHGDLIVKAVVLNADGTKKQIDLNMATKANEVVKVLGGPATICGFYPQIDVVMTSLREPKDAKINKNKLQPPFHKKEIKGSILLTKMVEAEPKDFTLAEYEDFLKLEIEEFEIEEPEEPVIEEEPQFVMEFDEEVIEEIKTAFKEENGREPTEQEIEETKAAVQEAMALAQQEEEEEESDDEEFEGDEEESDEESETEEKKVETVEEKVSEEEPAAKKAKSE
eukprot:TRINITY_DN777888_c0_g1_i1.p1 TRINITY_DN777888_c0_g1~~TRINITY_DN777888_c0_g1_i1.p1  ORF type:complete len:232 (+),score=121.53 TRINITY_DN777888_c0_g1_i1:93-788(+)